MKLRARQNSIRLRLTQSEVAQLKERGVVEESLDFGAATSLKYALVAAEIDIIQAVFQNDRIVVSVPRAAAENWADSDQVGLEHEQNTGTGRPLKILIEKDFACLERRAGEDDSDTFPHPLEKTSRPS